MTDKTQVPTHKDFLYLGLYQIFVTVICQVVLFILLQLTIAPVVVFDKLPEEFWEMSETSREVVQKEIIESVQTQAKEKPEMITQSYYSAIIQKSPSLFLLNNFLWFFGFVMTGYILFTWKGIDPLPDFEVSLGSNELNKGLLLGVIIFSIITLMSLVFYFIDYKPAVNEFQKLLFSNLKGNAYLLSWSIYTIGIVTGILEELYFRGYLLTQFIKINAGKFGLVFTSVLFGVLHYSADASPLVPVFITIVGYILGRAYLVTGNIWISMIGHAVYNTMGLVTAFMVGDKL
jgi:membrane protease YdiL (CAAX protease family)